VLLQQSALVKAFVANFRQLTPTVLNFAPPDTERYTGNLVASLFKLKLTTEICKDSDVAQLVAMGWTFEEL